MAAFDKHWIWHMPGAFLQIHPEYLPEDRPPQIRLPANLFADPPLEFTIALEGEEKGPLSPRFNPWRHYVWLHEWGYGGLIKDAMEGKKFPKEMVELWRQQYLYVAYYEQLLSEYESQMRGWRKWIQKYPRFIPRYSWNRGYSSNSFMTVGSPSSRLGISYQDTAFGSGEVKYEYRYPWAEPPSPPPGVIPYNPEWLDWFYRIKGNYDIAFYEWLHRTRTFPLRAAWTAASLATGTR